MPALAAVPPPPLPEPAQAKEGQKERPRAGPRPPCGRARRRRPKGRPRWAKGARAVTETRRVSWGGEKNPPGGVLVMEKKRPEKPRPAQPERGLRPPRPRPRGRGDAPPIGRTAKPVTGFRGRSGRTFRAKLRLE